MSARRGLHPVPRRGICRYCRCTENNACIVSVKIQRSNPAIKAQTTCSWINKQQTICSAPRCVRKHKIHERAKRMRRRIRVRNGRQLMQRRAS